jgi:hypothetical protein
LDLGIEEFCMFKKKSGLMAIIIGVALLFSFTACGGDPFDPDGDKISGIGTPSSNVFIVTNTAEWEAALNTIRSNSNRAVVNSDTYIITVNGNIPVSGHGYNSFGTGTLTVTINGNGRLYLTSPGKLILVGRDQTLIIDSPNLALEGPLSQDDPNNTETIFVLNGTLELRNGTIRGNNGCGVFIRDGNFIMTGGTITDSLMRGVYVKGNFTMSGGEITGNALVYVARGGGGVFIDGNFSMTGGRISNNTSGNNGGGVFVSMNSNFTMTGGEITGNTVKDVGDRACGGGVYLDSATSFTMEGGRITGNIASINFLVNRESCGGGVYLDGLNTFTMTGGSIADNTAFSTTTGNSRGGGVYVGISDTFTMTGGEITGNKAYSNSSGSDSSGGGVYLYGLSTFTMEGGEITNNTSSSISPYSRGGGVYVSGITFTMTGGEISGNTATTTSNLNQYAFGGGGVYVESPGSYTKTGGTIYGYTTGNDKSNVVKNGNGIVNNKGHAVLIFDYPKDYYRDTTAGPAIYMDSSKSGVAGGWEN